MAALRADFPFVEVPEEYKEIIGVPDEGTRLYRAYGPPEGIKQWFDAVCDICGENGSVSPGGAAGYSGVSRAAVHKRLKEGRLTGFLYHVVKDGGFFKNKKTLSEGGWPYCFVAVSECRAWAEELAARKVEKETVTKEDMKGEFFIAPKDWKNKLTTK